MPPATSRAPELTTDIAAVTFKYTIAGQVARRTDQHGVTLDFHYGTWADQTAGAPTLAVNQVTGVEVTCPSPFPVDRSLPDASGKLQQQYTVRPARAVVHRWADPSPRWPRQ